MTYKMSVVMVIAGLMSAFGQSETSKPMFFETPEACMSAKEGEFTIYLPHFTDNLAKWQKMVQLGQAEVVSDGKVRCAEEWSMDDKLVKGWRIVRWSDNNKFFRATDGRKADGRCGNTVRRLWEVPEPEQPAPPPPSAPSTPIPNRPPRERRERPEREQPAPPTIVEEKPCPTCVGIGFSKAPEGLKKNSPDLEAWPIMQDGSVTDGVWTWNGVEIGRGVRLTISPRRLYDMVHGKAGTYFLHFTGKDETGRVIACGLKGTPIELVRQGRHWFWKLPVVHCFYAYSKDIKNWSKGGTAEKLLACPAEAFLAWWLWPVSGSAAAVSGGTKTTVPVLGGWPWL